MVYVLAYSKTERDIQELSLIAKDVIAGISEDYWKIEKISSLQKLREYLQEKPLIHLLIYDICDRKSLEFLTELRKTYMNALIMLLADASVSPMEYIRPELRVSSLLLRPWAKAQAYDVLHGFFSEYMASFETVKNNGTDSYVIEIREGRISIPYEQIYFFEAREKKIYACVGKEEYGFYSSIEKISETLPGYFVRCHRGFIVNTKKIRKIMLSQNIICLCDDFDVPLSRSYKAALKGMGK